MHPATHSRNENMIKVFWYIAQMGNWQKCVKEQLKTIQKSGLHDAADAIYICQGGNMKIEGLTDKCKVIKRCTIDQFEFPALQMVKESTNADDIVLYIHTKGVSRQGREAITAGKHWRDYLMWGCVEHWQECVRALQKHDVAGVQWTLLDNRFKRLCGARAVFAGNFWWARGKYIRRLPMPAISKNRWEAEGWVSQGRCKVYDFHNLTNGKPITTKNTFSLPTFGRHVYAGKLPEQQYISINEKTNSVIYTVMVGKYENLKPAPRFDGWNTIAFVDDMSVEPNGWTLRHLPINHSLGKVRTSRLPRILPHLYLQDYQCSLYIDASVVIKHSPSKWIPIGALWAASKHWERHNVWQEIEANRVAQKAHSQTLSDQEEDYRSRRLYEKHIPLFQNCVIYRQHMNNRVIETCNAWWDEFCKFTCRDQLSLPMALAVTGLEVSEVTPRPTKSCNNEHWQIRHEGTHKSIYKEMPLYFMICNYRGSSISRGIQICKGLYDRGVRCQVISPSVINSIKHSTVVVVKELSNYITTLKGNGNTIIYDIVDNDKVWQNGLGRFINAIDAVIFPNDKLFSEWSKKGFITQKHTAVIEHHGDYRFTPNCAEKFNAVCICTSTQIPPEVHACGIDCITEENGWEGLFDLAKPYNLHIGVYNCNDTAQNKPATKLVTAAACRANIILQRTSAHLKLLPEYPYYVDDACEIPAMYAKCKADYGTQAWDDALALIEKVRQKTTIQCIASQYEYFIEQVNSASICHVTSNTFPNASAPKKAVVVGAGISGCCAARLLADNGYDVEVFETQQYIGGACADDDQIHLHGPHIFHTSDKGVWDFVNRFAKFKQYDHCVIADTDIGKLPIPYNYHSEQITGVIDDEQVKELIFEHYSKRQWGKAFSDLPDEITSRVHLRREGTDNRYFRDTYQGLPEGGYTQMLSQMTEGITVHLGCSPDDWKSVDCGLCIYTGSLDALLDYKHGKLPYRSLMFTQVNAEIDTAVLNNCKSDNSQHTRITNYKYLTGSNISIKETPVDYDGNNMPYYPIPFGNGVELAVKYRNDVPEHIVCTGRLGGYKYIDMDKAISDVFVALGKRGVLCLVNQES